MEDLELEQVCRLCLTKHEDMRLATEVGVIDRLIECASVVLPPDSLICDFCQNEVNKWYSFKQQVLKSLEVAKYIEKHRKKRSVLENNYVVIEECLVKTEIEEEIDVKPDISQIDNNFIKQPETVTIDNRKINNNKLRTNEETDNHNPPVIKQKTEHQCDLCHKSFISKLGMMWHKQLHSALKLDSSNGSNRPLFACPHCPMTYEKKLSLIDHMKWKHHRLMKRTSHLTICDFCGKYCKSKTEFRIHVRTHKGEKQFKCEVCNKSFVNVHNLGLHRSIHTQNEAPFTCVRCGRGFRKQSYLLNHQATHDRPYKCHKCNKTFGRKYTLKKHTETH